MKTYVGMRDRRGELKVWVRELDGSEKPLRHFVHHSPTGFECGYLGSGPADLALALAAEVLGEERRRVRIYEGTVGSCAFAVHQDLKFAIVADLPRGLTWELPAERVVDLVEGLLRDMRLQGREPAYDVDVGLAESGR